MDLFTQDWGTCTEGGSAQVATLRCIWPLFSNIINAAIVLSGVVALIFIIWSGIQIITANGDAEKVSGAKKTLTFAIVGFVFIALSLVIFNLVFKTLGVNQGQVGTNPNDSIQITPLP